MHSLLHTKTSSRAFRHNVPSFELADSELEQAEQLIKQQLSSGSDHVRRLLGCVNITGGKMLRPGLVILSAKAAGRISETHIRIAAIVEMIHAATLIHDDVMDEGRKRRNLPTVNSLWGNDSAVLLGDFILSRVFSMCSCLDADTIEKLAGTASQLCSGELRQVLERDNPRLSESDYIEIIRDKCASLFIVGCELGAALAGGNKKQIRCLSGFGLNLGIGFQIADDLLDIFGSEQHSGKTLGSDAARNKLTLPVIHLLRTAERKQKDDIESCLKNNRQNREKLRELLSRHGSVEYTKGRVAEFVGRAINELDGIKDSDARQALIDTAKYVAGEMVI